MTSIDYSQWRDDTLQQQLVDVHGHEMSYWATDIRKERPTLLFIHGITGDNNGLVPLAREFEATHNLILIELPGHGDSTRWRLHAARDLQTWFQQALETVKTLIAPVDLIIAHSFGCSAVVKTNNTDIVLLCPVPTPSRLYRQYARIIQRLSPFWALFYSWKIFIWLRGTTLRKVNTRDARRRVRWVGWQAQASYTQVIYQARLVDIILDATAYETISRRIKLVICGLEDTTARERDTAELSRVFQTAPVEFLRGGHLLPIESPERVAQRIKRLIA
jgi:pimeloyl-ACP methyl ester carboxylesterase